MEIFTRISLKGIEEFKQTISSKIVQLQKMK